jgi:predicted RNase H-like nuclease
LQETIFSNIEEDILDIIKQFRQVESLEKNRKHFHDKIYRRTPSIVILRAHFCSKRIKEVLKRTSLIFERVIKNVSQSKTFIKLSNWL